MTQDLTHGFHVFGLFLKIDMAADLSHHVHGDVETGLFADEFGQLFADIALSLWFLR